MAEMIFPSWGDVGLPEQFVELLNSPMTIRNDQLVEGLIYGLVYHNPRKIQYVYHCGVCGYQHKAQKSTDDYTTCEHCKSRAIRSTQYLCAPKRDRPPGSIGIDDFAKDILIKMRANYLMYFGQHFDEEEIAYISWKKKGFSCKFLGGIEAEDVTSNRAICRASILVPFLWDRGFDWKEGKRRRCQEPYILPLLHDWVVQRG